MAPNVATSKRLGLQVLNEEDHLQSYHAIMSDAASGVWSTSSHGGTIEESRAKMFDRQPSKEKPWSQTWAICLIPEDGRETSKVIGAVGFPRECEIGYRIKPQYWGKGYMTEALVMFAGMWFELDENKKYDRLLAAADPANAASHRVLQKSGFTKGEYKEKAYQRALLGDEKSDLQLYYMDRP
ncbi:GNAT domain-containing protein [Amylocarpus encephaloides]|uniref:GNAT domain-containing protein n=1 Tax=Amylocarpus encephaloides TaxID=45428 RepID=A0A9P7YK48_9HELO|nr:GNAT domain-containing protein [Amylocarpus encephaloides]